MAEINGNYVNPYSYGYNNNQVQQNYMQAQDQAYPALTAYNPGMDTVNFGNYQTVPAPEPEKKGSGKTWLAIGAALVGAAVFIGTKGKVKASGKTLTIFKHVAGEGAERTVKKGVSELAENAGKKAVEKATKEAGKELTKEAAEQIAKEAQEKVINNYAKTHVALFSKEGAQEVWNVVRHPFKTRTGLKEIKQADEELKAASQKWRELVDAKVDKNSVEYLEALKNKQEAAIKLANTRNALTENRWGNSIADMKIDLAKNDNELNVARKQKDLANDLMEENKELNKLNTNNQDVKVEEVQTPGTDTQVQVEKKVKKNKNKNKPKHETIKQESASPEETKKIMEQMDNKPLTQSLSEGENGDKLSKLRDQLAKDEALAAAANLQESGKKAINGILGKVKNKTLQGTLEKYKDNPKFQEYLGSWLKDVTDPKEQKKVINDFLQHVANEDKVLSDAIKKSANNPRMKKVDWTEQKFLDTLFGQGYVTKDRLDIIPICT